MMIDRTYYNIVKKTTDILVPWVHFKRVTKTAMSISSSEKEDAGVTHPKTVAINAASAATFFFSFAAYVYIDYILHMAVVVALSIIVAYYVPPRGWLRPSAFSDVPANRVMKRD